MIDHGDVPKEGWNGRSEDNAVASAFLAEI